jgi:taurine---2-oxoglutarate transaminase
MLTSNSAHVPPQRSSMQPLLAVGESAGPRVVATEGLDLVYEDGVRAIDMSAQDSSVIFGHLHPVLTEAMTRAVRQGFVSDTATGSPMRDLAVSRLTSVAFGDRWVGAVRFTSTGSEAIDLALALAQALTGRQVLVSRDEAYHGAVGLSRDTTTHPLINGALTRPGHGRNLRMPSGVPTVVIAAAESISDSELAAACDGAAAVITDYGSGHHYFSHDWFERVGRAAHAAGALWIHDETVSAYGRCGAGTWFHFHDLAVEPDMVAMGKCLTAGAAPGAALVLSERVIDMLDGRRWAAGSTFWGHPLQLAAIDATLTVMQDERIVEQVPAAGAAFGSALDQLVSRNGNIFSRHGGSGLLRSLVLHGDDTVTEPSPAVRFMELARVRGAQASAYGEFGMWLVPPLVIEQRDIDRALEAFEGAAEAMR